MPIVDVERLGVRAGRPDWLSAGLVRLLLLSGFIVGIGMLSPRLDPDEAWLVVGVGVGATAIGALWFLVAAKRLAARLPFLEDSARVSDAILLELRQIGLPLLGLGFFLLWTFVYVALWAFHPDEAFKGLAEEPRFADFFYYAVSTAFTSPPEGIAAGSRGARSATMIELFTAVALLGAYVSSFVDWRRGADRRARPEGDVDSSPRRRLRCRLQDRRLCLRSVCNDRSMHPRRCQTP
jgi:hypothetical protein